MKQRYFLGDKFPGLYFTKREVEVMNYLLESLTMKQIAGHFNLSPRTIEFYINNMKTKLKCHRVRELIKKMRENGFTGKLE